MRKIWNLLPGVITLGLFICCVVFYDAASVTDSQLVLLMNADAGTSVTTVMIAASQYGREYFWVGVLIIMLVLGKKQTKVMAVELAILFAVGIVGGEALKHLIYKARPFEAMSDIVTRVPKDYDSSFPSGHALIVTIGATYVLSKFKKILALALTCEAAIVAYSRVYVGMHYPLDVAAGVFLGSAIVFFWMMFFGRCVELLAERLFGSQELGQTHQ
jgi:membrane-associated phospholipid phosphatase